MDGKRQVSGRQKTRIAAWLSRPFALTFFLVAFFLPVQTGAESGPLQLYIQHCAACHGADRLGGMAPALLPDNLTRLSATGAAKAIADGLIATQMPGFGSTLSREEIQSLVGLIYTPPAQTPVWGMDEIRASRVEHHRPGSLPDTPLFKADPLNLFVVVELGDHHVTLLDGDRFEPIHRFPTRRALHGGPKFSPDGRYVYFASRDGWVSKFDIYNLKMTAEVRVGINTRNIAVSGDGKYVLAGNYLPHSAVLLDAIDLSPVRLISARDGNGRSSRVSAVYQADPRGSFVVALKDVKEAWEISYRDPVFPLRRIVTDDYLDDFFFDPSYRHLIGAARDGKKGWVIDLDSGKKIAELDLPGMPHLGSGITWAHRGRPVMATPNLKQGVVSVIDMQTWRTVKQVKTEGPGFFMRSHENTPYAWVDSFNSPATRDVMQVLDKRTLEIVKVLKPAPGKTTAHVEFTRDGKYALVSIWEMDGALVVYDAATLKEIKRLPMKKPSGKYNVHNKITRSAGTSH